MLGIFLDSEANGLNPVKHNIIEIAFKIINLSTGEEVYSYDEKVFQTKEKWEQSDPNSLKVNGFNYEMIVNGKKEDVIEKEIIDIFLFFLIVFSRIRYQLPRSAKAMRSQF